MSPGRTFARTGAHCSLAALRHRFHDGRWRGVRHIVPASWLASHVLGVKLCRLEISAARLLYPLKPDIARSTRGVLREHEAVRQAAANRYSRILVDEFQDTDPVQAEIIFLLSGSGAASRRWYDRPLVPGHLFMVGDPKQAIYRFRGADIATYWQAREAIERQFLGNVVRVSSNFRSRGAILQHINNCFRAPLQTQEAGYVELETTRDDAQHGLPCVAKIKIDIVPQSRVDDIRDEEARIVAETCARLIGG